MANETATGIMFSESLPEDVDLTKIENYDDMDDGDLMDWLDTPGHYIMKVISVKTQDDSKHKPSENVLLKVTAAEDETQVGKLHLERLYHAAADRAVKLGKRMGVWSAEQHQAMLDAVNAGEPAAGPEFSPCIGKEFVVEIKSEEYNGKTQCKVNYVGIWPLNHPSVANFLARVRANKAPATAAKTVNKAEPAPTTGKGTANTATGAATKKAAPTKKQPAAAEVDDL